MGSEYKELNGTKRIPPTLCTVSFEIYITYKWYVCMLDCSEQDGASGDTEEKMWRRAGGFSRGDGLGIVARAWRDSDGISRNATCFLGGGGGGGEYEGGNRKERVGEGGELR